jgi:DNA polymerase-1
VGISAAEIGCHIALGWPLPTNIFDTFAEFRRLINIAAPVKGAKPQASGLLDALEYFEIPIAIVGVRRARRSP